MYNKLHVVNQHQEEAQEYNIPLSFVFVDYDKAFDSIKFEPIFDAVKNHGVDRAYLNIIKHLYHETTSMIHLHTDSKKFRLQRGVRQGENISHRLLTSSLQDAIIGTINWKDRGIKINGEYLSHLIFADDIILIAKWTSELQKMLQDIHETSKPVGLNMHLGKTKVMCNPVVNKTDININGRKIEAVNNYIYLGQMVTEDHNQEQELRCRIGLGWTTFGKLDSIMWNRCIPLRLKTKVHNECKHSVIMYGSETWSLSKTQLQKMVTIQYKMEWIMMGLTLHDRKVQARSAQRQVSLTLSTKFAPTSTDGQGTSHGWKTTGGPNVWQSCAHENTSSLGVIQKDIGRMTLKKL